MDRRDLSKLSAEELLAEVQRLYKVLRTVPKAQRRSLEARIREVSQAYAAKTRKP